jgi:hypothetical protein
MKNEQNLDFIFSQDELNSMKSQLRQSKPNRDMLRTEQLENRSEVKVWSLLGFSLPALF